jgi:hypothetical protein
MPLKLNGCTTTTINAMHKYYREKHLFSTFTKFLPLHMLSMYFSTFALPTPRKNFLAKCPHTRVNNMIHRAKEQHTKRNK